MTKLQKMALFNLGLATCGLFFQLFHVFGSDLWIRLIASIVTLVLCCFLAVSYFHRKKFAKQGGRQYDERDKAIHKTAALAGFVAAFAVFFMTTLALFLIVGPGGSLAIGHMLTIFMLSALGLFFAESIAVLIQYSRGSDNGGK